MKILVGIPVLSGYDHTKNAIESVLSQKNVDLLIIDNGADLDLKALFILYSQDERVTIISNPENRYVNPAWNQIVRYFLASLRHDYLVIMNSDLLMNKDWSRVLLNRFITYKNESYLPNVIEDRTLVDQDVSMESVCQEVTGGVPGIFITLTKEQAKLIYPITEDCLIWYGDNWIYDILRGCGHKTVILNNLIAHHGLSQTVSRLIGIDKLIEFDTKLWPDVQIKIQEVIERNKGK